MASQITSLTIVYSTVYSDADQRKYQKLRVTGLCVGNSPGTGEFPAQMASNRDLHNWAPDNSIRVTFRPSFDDVIMIYSVRALPMIYISVSVRKFDEYNYNTPQPQVFKRY